MIDVHMQYQASLFADAKDITPVPDTMTQLITAFSDKALIPNTFQEIGSGSPVPQSRLGLSSPNGEWRILFATGKIDLTKNPTDPRGTNLGELPAFCADAVEFFGRILTIFPKRSRRIALVTSFLLKEMTDEHLSAVYSKLFSPPSFFVTNPPFEWNWRTASTVPSGFMEPPQDLNVLLSVNRQRGDFNTDLGRQPFERLSLTIDINTSPGNADYRFLLPEIEAFYQTNLTLHDSLLAEVLDYVRD